MTAEGGQAHRHQQHHAAEAQPQRPRAAARAEQHACIGDAQTVYLVEHNTTTGMSDYRGAGPTSRRREKRRGCTSCCATSSPSSTSDPDRALAEVNADYSTMTEVADTLMRVANVPFRIGHHFASELTNYGRRHGKTPQEIPYSEAVQIYKEATGEKLPLTEAQFKEALSAGNMVFNRHGLGGPQISEVKRMQQAHESRLASDTAWVTAQRSKLQASMALLVQAFDQLTSS